MTRVVWKYELDLVDHPQIRPMPKGSRVVHVHGQVEVVCLWVEVDPVQTFVDRAFLVRGTGHPVEDDSEYVGTAHTYGGSLVWHVYEQLHV